MVLQSSIQHWSNARLLGLSHPHPVVLQDSHFTMLFGSSLSSMLQHGRRHVSNRLSDASLIVHVQQLYEAWLPKIAHGLERDWLSIKAKNRVKPST